MFRISGIMMILFAFVLGGILFWTSQSVQRSEEKLLNIKTDIAAERDTERVFSTEWSYLNRPERLEKLADEILTKNEDTESAPVIIDEVNDIPEPIIPAIPQIKPARYVVPTELAPASGGVNE